MQNLPSKISAWFNGEPSDEVKDQIAKLEHVLIAQQATIVETSPRLRSFAYYRHEESPHRIASLLHAIKRRFP